MPRPVEIVNFQELPMEVTDMPIELSGEAFAWGDQNFAVMGHEEESVMGLEDPRIRSAFIKGWHGLVIEGVSPNDAANFCGLNGDEYNASISGLWGRIKRSVKRGVRKTKRFVSKAVRLAKLLAKRALNSIIFKIAFAIGKVLKKVPNWLLRKGSIAAGVNPKYVIYFKKIMKYRRPNLKKIKKLLPMSLAVGAKIVAQTGFPPLAAVFRFIRRIPKVMRNLMLRIFPRSIRKYAKIAIAGDLMGMEDVIDDSPDYPVYVTGDNRPMSMGIQVMAHLSGV